MTEEQATQRDHIREALTKLLDINEKDEPLPRGVDGLIGCAHSAATGQLLPGNEPCDGAIVILIGARGSQTAQMVGAFNPIMAYGGLVDAMFEVRAACEVKEVEQAVKSFVGDAQAALASIEKELTQPDEH